MRRANYYHVNFSTRHPLLIEVMEALKGTRRLSYFVATSLEAFLATEEGKMAAQHVMRASGEPNTSSPKQETSQSSGKTKPGFDLDSILP